MLTVDKIKEISGMYNIPKSIHINKHLTFDYRLFRALTNPDYEDNKDYRYDFDVYLPTYGINLQRPYVWELCQQREFILSILQEKPIDEMVIISHNSDAKRRETTNYVIDGKQRLLTVKKFANNEFSIIVGGKEYYFKDFDDELKLYFSSRVDGFVATVYYSYDDNPLTDDMKIILFNYYNFSGTPQTEEHKNRLQSLLNKNNNSTI